MLQKTFSIYADNLDDCRLFIEAGRQHIACWCKDAATGAAKAFEFFQFDAADENEIDNTLHEVRLHSKLMDLPISPDTILWDNEEAICVPAAFYREDIAADYLTTMMGETDNVRVLAQPLDKQVILSRQKVTYTGIFKKQFSATTFSHKFFVLLKKYMRDTGHEEVNRVYVIFYPSHFIITAIKENILQVIRSIGYSTSEDALYSIMHICGEHDMPLSDTAVIVSGLIDTASNLYNILFSYLEKFTLAKDDTTIFATEGFAEYPAHYFLPFIQE